jgi:hypothetical protein
MLVPEAVGTHRDDPLIDRRTTPELHRPRRRLRELRARRDRAGPARRRLLKDISSIDDRLAADRKLMAGGGLALLGELRRSRRRPLQPDAGSV